MKLQSIVFLPVLLIPIATSLPIPDFEDTVREKVDYLVESGFFGEGVESSFHPGAKGYGLLTVHFGFKDKPDRAWWRGKEILRGEEKVDVYMKTGANTEAELVRGL